MTQRNEAEPLKVTYNGFDLAAASDSAYALSVEEMDRIILDILSTAQRYENPPLSRLARVRRRLRSTRYQARSYLSHVARALRGEECDYY